jgi:hypothetical protein
MPAPERSPGGDDLRVATMVLEQHQLEELRWILFGGGLKAIPYDENDR